MVSVSSSVYGGVSSSYINHNEKTGQKALSSVASGKSVNKASDNAAGLAIASAMQSDVTTLRQSGNNLVQGTSLLQTAEGGLQQAGGILNRMKELATQANSGALDSNSRSAINTEYQNLLGELNGIGSKTSFNGQNLLDGSYNSTFQSGVAGTDVMSADLSGVNISSSGLGLTAANGANAGALLSQSSAAATANEIDNAISSLQSSRSQVGSVMSGFSTMADNIDSAASDMTEAESAIADADFAAQMTKLNDSKLLTDTSIAAAAQGNKLKSSLLKLVR